MEHTPQLVSYSRRMDEGSTICAMASWLGRTRRVEQERGAVEMPFMSIRAPNAVQYRGVCTGVKGASGTRCTLYCSTAQVVGKGMLGGRLGGR